MKKTSQNQNGWLKEKKQTSVNVTEKGRIFCNSNFLCTKLNLLLAVLFAKLPPAEII
jgi:hypothetical protein